MRKNVGSQAPGDLGSLFGCGRVCSLLAVHVVVALSPEIPRVVEGPRRAGGQQIPGGLEGDPVLAFPSGGPPPRCEQGPRAAFRAIS